MITKFSFLFLGDVQKCSKLKFEKMKSLTDMVFGLYASEKKYINLTFGTPDVQIWFYNIYYWCFKNSNV